MDARLSPTYEGRDRGVEPASAACSMGRAGKRRWRFDSAPWFSLWQPRNGIVAFQKCPRHARGLGFLQVIRLSTSHDPSGIGGKYTRAELRFRALVQAARAGILPIRTNSASPPGPLPQRIGWIHRRGGIGWDRIPLPGSHSFALTFERFRRRPRYRELLDDVEMSRPNSPTVLAWSIISP